MKVLTASRTTKFESIALTLLFLALTFFFSNCARRSRQVINPAEFHAQTIQREATEQQSPTDSSNSGQTRAPLINLNTASASELETLPGIGKGLAERIIEHREKFGPFRRVEHLIIVRGISDRRFRGLRDLVTVE
jgi:competence ComEA-like helix-hairpin-helix protein